MKPDSSSIVEGTQMWDQRSFIQEGESQSDRAQGKGQTVLALASSVDFTQQKILKHLRGKLGRSQCG